MKKLFVIVASLFLVSVKPVLSQELTILTENLPPLNYVENGVLVGPSVETVREIQRRVGSHAPIQVYPWARAYKMSLEQEPDVHYETKEILLSPGESMLFFTDGVLEAENKNNELFGNDRLASYIKNTKGPPWGKGLLDLVSGWRGKASANDDLTILEIWRS